MLLSDYSYDLPDRNIAKFPPKVRGSSRLVVLHRQDGSYQDSYYKNLDNFLETGDLIIMNDTKVMRSRLFTQLPDGRPRELVVLEKHQAAKDENPYEAHVMYKGRIHPGDQLTIVQHIVKNTIENANQDPQADKIQDTVVKTTTHQVRVKEVIEGGFAIITSEHTPIDQLVTDFGAVPLPPYLHRDADAADTERYQTVWAKNLGSAAAPTASLNMTDDLMQRLQAKGIQIKYLTLHVGLGTFLPIRTDNIEDHKMHSEWFNIPADTIAAIQATKAAGHRVIALGTTVTRTLEFWGKTGQTQGEDNIFIYPGFDFKVIDALLTNFHAPKSTVLMLASAFAGWDHIKNCYEHCIAADYKLLSYGDSMLII